MERGGRIWNSLWELNPKYLPKGKRKIRKHEWVLQSPYQIWRGTEKKPHWLQVSSSPIISLWEPLMENLMGLDFNLLICLESWYTFYPDYMGLLGRKNRIPPYRKPWCKYPIQWKSQSASYSNVLTVEVTGLKFKKFSRVNGQIILYWVSISRLFTSQSVLMCGPSSVIY